jgi:hypothetical protein
MQPGKTYRDPQRLRLLLGALLVAAVVAGFVLWATLSMDRVTRRSGAFTGTIVAKEFTPGPAQEITFGSGGLVAQKIEGEYLLKVQAPDGSRVFHVWVDRPVYDEYEVGDRYYVVPSP